MSLKDLDLDISYDSDANDLVRDFYIPVLNEAFLYQRIAGFFSSTSLAIAARGIRGLIDNNGKMQLIVSPRLSATDKEVIEKAEMSPISVIEESMLKTIEDVKDALDEDYIAAMGWLIANDILTIKIAVVYDDAGKIMDYKEAEEKGLFHIKVGIVTDKDGNTMSFSGSINETASGWIRNTEEFKVYKMWKDVQCEYCKKDIARFQEYWAGSRGNTKVYNIPDAVKQELLKRAPEDIDSINCLKGIKNKKYEKKEKVDIQEEKCEEFVVTGGLSLFSYQNDAVNMWEENNKRLLFEMATGTGKTRTAIGCMNLELVKKDTLLVVIVCPQGTLSLQWKDDIEYLQLPHDAYVVADSSVRNWRVNLEEKLLDLSLGIINTCIVYTVFRTFSSRDFINLITKYKRNAKYLLVGDEAHGLGATKTSIGLLECYEYRIGLSATPSRWYDDIGTDLIKEYFGGKIFEFSIKEALHTINPLTGQTYLTKYKYHPVFTTLTDEELDDYEEKTRSLVRMKSKINDDKARSRYEQLLCIRANVHKNAYNKYTNFETILDNLDDDITDTIIFVSDQQIDKVIAILGARGIRAHRFTSEQGKVKQKKYGGKTERQYIIDKFVSQDYQVLVAIKCLDEGIDIPSAKRAILMASSTNPREYIQRIGRVIRRFEGKHEAEIYDIIIKPELARMSSELRDTEIRIFEKEMQRVFEISENALNNVGILKKVNDIRREMYGWM